MFRLHWSLWVHLRLYQLLEMRFLSIKFGVLEKREYLCCVYM